ncbi:CopD family protein [Pseudogemmatithrix spongiicola]|uniref:CopD family protein n=1 Tax=Pseudogemmatithrix spongiicola TaxID=3062599 RepID=UPI003464F53A
MMESVFGVESPAFVAIRAVLSACTVLLLGTLALRFVVLRRYAGPDARELRDAIDSTLPRWIDALGLVALLATLARLGAQHAAVFGGDVAPSGESLSALLFRAGWGRTWWVALVSALTVTWIAPRLRGNTIASWAALAGAVFAFTVAQPWSGHPAAAAQPMLAIATQFVHVVGAGGWLGSLALLTFVAVPAAGRVSTEHASSADARVAALVRAFSPTALIFASLLAVTGLATAWVNLGSAAALWQSVYGRTLLLKLALLVVVAGTGAYNWRRVLPSLGQSSGSTALRRSSLVELAAGVLVLVVTAVLVATPMPGE